MAKLAPAVGPLLVVLAALAPGCSSRSDPVRSASVPSTTVSPSASVAAAGFRLRPLTRPELAACRRLAAAKPVVVLCPTLLPQPRGTDPSTPVGVYTFPVCHALVKGRGCPLYDLAVLYGAPNESPGHGAENTPARFLHFELLGGRYILDATTVHSFSGGRPLQRLVGARTIAGHRGHLYFGLPYDRGGGEYGSHYTFVWRQGPWRYAASLHSWRPHRQTLAVLAAIIDHLVTQPDPGPETTPASLHISVPRGWAERTAPGGGLAGVRVLLAANFSLPAAAAACGGQLPRLTRGDAVVRIYDYGPGASAGSARAVSAVHIGHIRTRHQARRNPPTASYARMRYRGHLLVVDAGPPTPRRRALLSPARTDERGPVTRAPPALIGR